MGFELAGRSRINNTNDMYAAAAVGLVLLLINVSNHV